MMSTNFIQMPVLQVLEQCSALSGNYRNGLRLSSPNSCMELNGTTLPLVRNEASVVSCGSQEGSDIFLQYRSGIIGHVSNSGFRDAHLAFSNTITQKFQLFLPHSSLLLFTVNPVLSNLPNTSSM